MTRPAPRRLFKGTERAHADPPRSPVATAAAIMHIAMGALVLWLGFLSRQGPDVLMYLDPVLASSIGGWPDWAPLLVGLIALVWFVLARGLWMGSPAVLRCAVAWALLWAPVAVRWLWSGPTWLVATVALAYIGPTLLLATEPLPRGIEERTTDERSTVVQGRRHMPKTLAGLSDVLDDPVRMRALMWSFIGIGVVLRVVTLWTMEVRYDGATYSAMGHAWAQHGSFLMPWGRLVDAAPVAAFSHHYPPFYPLLLGVAYRMFGFGVVQTQVVSLIVSLLALLVVYATSKDLYGHAVALLATAILAVEPHLIWTTGTAYSENLVLILFAITLWAILRSIDRHWFILLAGLAAALAYLTRSSLGAFFVIAGIGGLGWRLYHKGLRVFRDVPYLIAAGVFLVGVSYWSLRNDLLHDALPWQSSAYVSQATSHAWSNVSALATATAYKIPFFAFLLAPYIIFFMPAWKRSWQRIRSEHVSALWLAVGLVVLLGWTMASVFWTWEGLSLFWSDNRRYLVLAFLPMLWIALGAIRTHDRPQADPKERPESDVHHPDQEFPGTQHESPKHTRRRTASRPAMDTPPEPTSGPTPDHLWLRATMLASVLLASSVLVFFAPVQAPETMAAQALADHIEAGDTIAYDGPLNKYALYPYLPRHDIIMQRLPGTDATPKSIMDSDASSGAGQGIAAIITFHERAQFAGFTAVGTWEITYLTGNTRTVALWVVDDQGGVDAI